MADDDADRSEPTTRMRGHLIEALRLVDDLERTFGRVPDLEEKRSDDD